MIALALLLALIVYGVLAWSVIRALGWLGRVCVLPPASTRALQGITLAAVVLLPTWDIIPSRLYFEHLCETEAGIKVSRIVEVDQSYFRPNGSPDDKKLLARYAQSNRWNRDFSSWAHIAKIEWSIQDRGTGELLGSATDFTYYGGWVETTIAPMSPATCPVFKAKVFGMALEQIFRLKQPSLSGRN